MNIHPVIYIFSVEKSDLSWATNTKNTIKVGELLTKLGIPFSKASGVYKGQSERSFVVVDHALVLESFIKQLCSEYKQECYLKAHTDRTAQLIFMDGYTEDLGHLLNVGQSRALQKEVYTYVDSQWFITE